MHSFSVTQATSDTSITRIRAAHGRLSLRKAGELLSLSHKAIANILRSGNLELLEMPETLIQKGLDGGNLAVLVEYYAFDSHQASPETVAQCRKIYRQASAKGFQDFIDAVLGISTQQPALTMHEQVKADLDVLRFCLDATGLRKELLGGVMLNYAGTHLPQLKSAINEAHAALAASTPVEDVLLTPTKIGERLGVSARKVNLVLMDLGYQVKNLNKTSKDEPAYFATDIGKPYASNTLATGRLYENGADNTSYQHLKWKPQILDILSEQLVGYDL